MEYRIADAGGHVGRGPAHRIEVFVPQLDTDQIAAAYVTWVAAAPPGKRPPPGLATDGWFRIWVDPLDEGNPRSANHATLAELTERAEQFAATVNAVVRIGHPEPQLIAGLDGRVASGTGPVAVHDIATLIGSEWLPDVELARACVPVVNRTSWDVVHSTGFVVRLERGSDSDHAISIANKLRSLRYSSFLAMVAAPAGFETLVLVR